MKVKAIKENMKPRVVVGMSGGVDSSVAAALLKDQGYEVIGVTMQIWPDLGEEEQSVEGGCCSLSAVSDARRVCDRLGIRYYVMNFKEIFDQKVIKYFINDYLHGNTPNPCIACNKYIKFDELLRRAQNIGADYVATGHYASVVYDEDFGRYLLKRSADIRKDQTYALYNLTQEQLSHIIMPLAGYTKDTVRKIAGSLNLPVANKPDSEEICFVKDNNYGRYIEENTPVKIEGGYFKDTNGNILGRHNGIIHYTIGQRKGLGITFGKPMYVIDIRPEDNSVVLGDESEVFSDTLFVRDLNFIPFDNLSGEMEVSCKIRYTGKESPAVIAPYESGMVKVKFVQPQRAITPGQSAVFYKDDVVIGGGIIKRP
jgi:tRNA (5-methylaminomethyl-2-thiouridylate)-methyltransferase